MHAVKPRTRWGGAIKKGHSTASICEQEAAIGNGRTGYPHRTAVNQVRRI
jgi:hypothetical protein